LSGTNQKLPACVNAYMIAGAGMPPEKQKDAVSPQMQE